MRLRSQLVFLAGLVLVSIGSGCPMQIPTVGSDFTLSSTARTAQSSGTSAAGTNVGVFSCRATSTSPNLLAQDAFFPSQPNFTMTLSDVINGLTVRVTSNDEFVLWIRMGNNNFCNKAQEGFINRGSWSAGVYEIFIGAPTQGATVSYTLKTE